MYTTTVCASKFSRPEHSAIAGPLSSDKRRVRLSGNLRYYARGAERLLL